MIIIFRKENYMYMNFDMPSSILVNISVVSGIPEGSTLVVTV